MDARPPPTTETGAKAILLSLSSEISLARPSPNSIIKLFCPRFARPPRPCPSAPQHFLIAARSCCSSYSSYYQAPGRHVLFAVTGTPSATKLKLTDPVGWNLIGAANRVCSAFASKLLPSFDVHHHLAPSVLRALPNQALKPHAESELDIIDPGGVVGTGQIMSDILSSNHQTSASLGKVDIGDSNGAPASGPGSGPAPAPGERSVYSSPVSSPEHDQDHDLLPDHELDHRTESQPQKRKGGRKPVCSYCHRASPSCTLSPTLLTNVKDLCHLRGTQATQSSSPGRISRAPHRIHQTTGEHHQGSRGKSAKPPGQPSQCCR